MDSDFMKMSFHPIKENGIKRCTDIITIAVFTAAVFTLAVLFWILPDKEFSEEENRSLQQTPEISLEQLINGKLTNEVGTYYADQFPFRNMFVGVKTTTAYLFGMNENKGAVIGKDGYIIQRFDIYDDIENNFDDKLTFNENMKNIEINLSAVNTFRQNTDANVVFIIPPRKIDVMINKLPAFFSDERNGAFYAAEHLSEVNSPADLSLTNKLKEYNDEYIYYKTDHHWTTLGAYYAYSMLGENLGYTPLEQDDFIIEEASVNFYGTTISKAGIMSNPFLGNTADKIYYYTQPDEESIYKTEIVGVKIIDGFYDREKLGTKDKYASFIGGINAHTKIYKTGGAETSVSEEREKLLFITDSFGQSLAPFLARHYDIEILDLRFYNKSIVEFIEENNITNVLILQNMESLSSQQSLRLLALK